MRVTVRMFARYAELTGVDEMKIDLHQPVTVAGLVEQVRSTVANGDRLPAHPMVAINEEHVLPDRKLNDGDVVALLPPLAGG